MHTVAIVLAGGKSSRMGVDKLQLPVGKDTSTTVLHHVVDVCNRVSDEVWLADTTTRESLDDGHGLGEGTPNRTAEGPPTRTAERLPNRTAEGLPIRRVHDKTAYQGPLQAISNIWGTLLSERGGKFAPVEEHSGTDSVTDSAVDSVPNNAADSVPYSAPYSVNEDDAAVFLIAGDLPGLHDQVLQTCRDMLECAPRDVDAVLVTREGRWQPLIGCYRIRCGVNFERIAQTGEPRLMRAVDLLHILPVAAEEERWPDWWTKPVHTREEYQQWLDFYQQALPEPERPAKESKVSESRAKDSKP